MRQRFFFSYSEDIRMLKWVVRNEPIKPLGTSIWSYYIETYRSDHTVQSLVGRMRRNVIPNMDFYLKKMKTDEKIALLRIFGQRIDNQKRTVIRNSILVSQDSTNQTRRDQRIPKTVLNCNPISNHDKQWFIEERTNIASHQRSTTKEVKRTHFSEGIQLDELFDKMLIVPKNMNAPLISTRSSILKAARMRYHFKMLKELRQLAVNPHVRSAVFMYFQYFEYYISFYVSDILETYAEVMNLLFQVSIKLATL
ncbi:Protein CBG04226 [Caenorhabditis briggsae]|uniref:Protein CBG04226 n=1 Tax=Caenorhabditis briggsae TaxID=6238 RepID=A8WWG6_CAEBR|nr:Protein CBG04226 [Caenorhabditis briggsae]CAP24975.1 Protein CBG04226 [Caenorhabditis briggsae]